MEKIKIELKRNETIKKITITKEIENEIKEIQKGNCVRDIVVKVAQKYNINEYLAYKLTSAISYNYKYLIVKE